MSLSSEQIMEYPRIRGGKPYWFWAAVEPKSTDEKWVTVGASHWGAPRLDLPEPIEGCAAAFSTREAALTYREAAPEGSVAAAHRWLVRAVWEGRRSLFVRVGEFEQHPLPQG